MYMWELSDSLLGILLPVYCDSRLWLGRLRWCVLSRFFYLDPEYAALPTANHYMNDSQCTIQANSVVHCADVDDPLLGS